jgi:hypothetical protein
MTNVGLVDELYDSFNKFPLFIVMVFEIYILIGKEKYSFNKLIEVLATELQKARS